MALNAHGGSGRMDGESETFVASPVTASYAKHGGAAAGKDSKPHNIVAQPLRVGRQYSDMGDGSANVVAHALRADGFDASEDGTGRGTPLVGVTIHGTGKTARVASYTDTAGALRARTPGGQENSSTMAIQAGMAVRRLTPRECERLQGFPDDYTAIPYRGKPAADGPRYKALGNSMAVPVMRWIGQRIEATHE
jgi:DNA (cytosine-5)-methyltransferase 1